MGKTKTVIIDDSQPTAEVQSSKLKVKNKKPLKKEEDSLVAKLREELGIEGEKKEKLDASSKIKHPTSQKIRSKKYQAVVKDLDRSKFYPINEALDMVKKMSYSKFNGTLEAHISTAQTGLRGFTSLPFASGKKIKIILFATPAQLGLKQINPGEDYFGANLADDSTIEQIEKGAIKFDLIITTPDFMHKLARVAKFLGPIGLMPNPKNGTIVEGKLDSIKKAVEAFLTGKTEFKTEAKAPIIHIALGKLTQPNEELEANIKIILSTLGKTKIKKVTLSPTMGPGVKLDLGSI